MASSWFSSSRIFSKISSLFSDRLNSAERSGASSFLRGGWGVFSSGEGVIGSCPPPKNCCSIRFTSCPRLASAGEKRRGENRRKKRYLVFDIY